MESEMQFYVMTRNEPSTDEITRSILERTDDAHRENKDAISRYAVNMIATVCGCGDVIFYPIDPQFVDMIETVDSIAAERWAERVEFEGHLWHGIGPLDDDDMEALRSAALGFFFNWLVGIEVTGFAPEPELDRVVERKDSESLH
jgi:hypothetical protein